MQILEARAAGADSVLLIAACLDDAELSSMLAAARDLGMEPLVETHTDLDLERVLATDARLVGVNARDLETLDVDLPSAPARLATDRLRPCRGESRAASARTPTRGPPVDAGALPSWSARP